MTRSVPWPLTSRYALAGVLAIVLAAISGLAYASPADPSWASGVYDDADFDDVVGLVISAEALVPAEDTADLPLVLPGTSSPASPSESAILRFPTATLHARAPPHR
jgi:hypothetical protein